MTTMCFDVQQPYYMAIMLPFKGLKYKHTKITQKHIEPI